MTHRLKINPRARLAGPFASLVLAAFVLAPSPGCRKQSPPPAPAEPAASAPSPVLETPASETAPVVTSGPAPAPAPAPVTAPAPAPATEPVALPAAALEKLRLDAEARREEARAAGAYRDAFELWEQADAALAARSWAQATGLFDRATKLSAALAQARAHLTGQRFAEASTALAGALAIDPAAPAALGMQEEIRLAVGQKDLLPAKTQAEAAVAAAVALNDAHGFAAIQFQLRQDLRKASGHYARGRFAEAGAAYKSLLAACERVKVLDTARVATETLRAQADAARAKAAAADAFAGANGLLMTAAKADDAAARAQAAGDFDTAKAQWTAAIAAYEQAATTGAAVVAVRTQLAAKQYPAALAAAQALAKGQLDNKAAQALPAEVATAKSRDDALALQAASQQALTVLAALDGAGPFGEWKAAAWARHLAGERLLAAEKFADAGKEYQNALAECDRVKALDVARQGLGKTRTALAAQRQAGALARANRAAPARWDRAESESAAGETAFQKGDYETAKTTWTAASREYDAALAGATAMATARTQLAAGTFAEAAKSVQAALTADATSAGAKSLAGEIDRAAQRAAAQPVRAAALADLKAASDFDGGQGFFAARQEAWKQFVAAEGLFEADRFAEAVAAYKALSVRCGQFKPLDAARQACAALRTQAGAKRQEVLTAGGADVARVAGAAWSDAAKTHAAAEAAYEKGDFETATKLWTQTTQRYTQAGAVLAAAAVVRDHLAAGRAAEAVKAAQAALAGDAQNAYFQRALADAQAGVARQAVAAARLTAETAMDALAALDEGQGFAAARARAWKALAAADALADAGPSDPATAAYAQVTAEAARLVKWDTVRKAAAASRATLLTARASGAGTASWQAGEKARAEGEKAFEDGDADGAGKSWAAAQALYVKAAGDVADAAKVRAALQEWLTARGRLGGEGEAVLKRVAGAKWAAIAELLARGEAPGRPADERAAAYRQAAGQWTALKTEAATALAAQAQEAVKAKKFPDAVTAAAAAMMVDAANGAAQNALAGFDPAAVEAATAGLKARAGAAVAGIAAMGDGQTIGAIKTAAAAQLAAGGAAAGQKQAAQAVAGYVSAIVECERARGLDGKRQETAKRQAVVGGMKQEAAGVGAATAAQAMVGKADQAAQAGEQAFAGGDFDTADAKWTEAAGEYETAIAVAKGMTAAAAFMTAKKYDEAAAAALATAGADPDNAGPRALWREAVTAARRVAGEPAKAAAEAALVQMGQLEAAPGLVARKQAATAKAQEAATAWAGGLFEKAQRGYVAATGLCAQVREAEAKRGETAKRQAVVGGNKQEGVKGEADKEAPGLWSWAEAAMAGAQQAVGAGEYELADARLADAAAGYDAATAAAGAIRQARAKLAAKEFDAATTAVLAAAQADLGSEVARKLAGEIRVAAAMEAAGPAKAKAEAAVKDLTALADTQGFAARKSEVQQAMAAAAEAWGKAGYEEAAWRFEAAAGAGRRAREAQGRREDVAKRQAVGKGKGEEGKKGGADKAAPTLWQQGEGAMTAATAASEAGAFEEAAELIEEATTWWARAGELADALVKAQALATAGKGAEALTALRAVLVADAASVPAATAIATLETAARKAALEPVRVQAEAVVAELPALADTEGFAALKLAAQQTRTTAAEHLAAGRFDQAEAGYVALAGACGQLKALEARRKACAAGKAQADAAALKVQAMPDTFGFQAAKAYALQEQAAATGLYGARRFDEAGERYEWATALMGGVQARDTTRVQTEKAKAEIDGRAAKPQAATLNVTAPEYWQAGEATRAAGQAAYLRGDFETAARQWTFAAGWLDAGEAMIAAVRNAEALAAAGKLAEAREAIAAAREAGFDNALAAQVETAIRYAIARRDLEPLRRRAEASLAEAAQAAPGQGVEAIRQVAQQRAVEAKQRYDANDFDQATRLTREVVVECDGIVRTDARRALSQPLRAAATAALAQANALTDAHGFAAVKTQIRQTFAAAETFFEQRRFDQADGPYQATTAECKRLAGLEAARVELDGWRQKLPAEQQKAAAAEVPKWAAAKWAKMNEALQAGQAAFDQGDFVTARAKWEPLLKGYTEAAANVEVLKAVYDGQLLWDQAKGFVPKEYFDQMDRYGGAEWDAVKALVAAGEDEKLPQAERIGAYKKAALQLVAVAGKVEDLHRRAMCAQIVAEAKELLAGVPVRATERTAEHLARAQKAVDTVARALAYRPGDPAAADVAQEARTLATALKPGVCLRITPAQKAWLLALAMDTAGEKAVTGGEDSSLRLWDVWRGTQGGSWEGHAGGTYAVAFAADGRTVLSGGEDAMVRLSAPAGGREPVRFVGHTAPVTGVAFAPDGRTVLSSSEDGTLRLWDVAGGPSVRTFTGHTGSVNAVAFSPDGKTALSAGADRTVRVWETSTGRSLRTLEGHAGAVTGVAWSGDGAKAASASLDKTVKIWDVSAGRVLFTLTGHTAGVNCVAFSPDGRRAISGARDETVRLWDVASGTCAAVFEGHRGWVRGVAFGPDALTAASVDETVLKVWYVGKEAPATQPKPGP